LTGKDLDNLYQAIRCTLRAGIMYQGASLDAIYRGGQFQNHFQVYGRDGQPCLTCGTEIQKIVLGGRGTHFCSNCQK
jgi:formamidopyrimidine-DNA glycosylase